jgi:hypothetical protein
MYIRMNRGRVVRKIFESELEGRRRRGRPRLRWLEDVEKDLWEMRVKRCRQQAVSRQGRMSVCKEGGQGAKVNSE